MKQSADLLAAGIKIIDLSADFRLKDPLVFEKWYKHEHSAKEALLESVYGLPEIFRDEIKSARLVANPGCYPTASALALIPLLKNKLIDLNSIIIDAKSGTSGAGRGKHSLDLHFPELNENFKAYGVAGTHRHTPEIEQTLSFAAGKELVLSFTPHLLPITRGILASCYANLSQKISCSDIISHFRDFYKGHPFVFILDEGQLPTTKGCYGTNQCHIGIAVDTRTNRVTVFSAIDNLVKGAAGQAVQNFNLMCGFDEISGLVGAGLWP
jgi:N-acetyl-gamma-glutamyl-phosphate reductase